MKWQEVQGRAADMKQPRQVLRRGEHSTMSAVVDPAFKAIPRASAAFIIWRIENMQVVALPKEQYGNFYSGDSYIVYAASELGKTSGTDTKVSQVNGPLEVHLHFWLGSATSTDEAGVAVFKTVELDDYLGGHPVQHREVQGNESNRFKSYFKSGIRVLKGGVSSGLNTPIDIFEPCLFRVKGRRSPVTTQLTDISWDHFNSGDVFVLCTRDAVFLWVGRMANPLEKLQATKVAMKLQDEYNINSIVFVDDGFEHRLPATEKLVFNQHLNLKKRLVKTADEGNVDLEVDRATLTLYHCSDEEGTYKVIEVKSGPLYQSDLSSEDSFIIDNGVTGIWVWVGRRASPKERVEAMRNAHGFVTKKGYPNNTPVTRVVDGGEPVEFKVLFTSWRERSLMSTLQPKANSARLSMTIHTRLDAGTLHEHPQIAAASQLVDNGSGDVEVWRVEDSALVQVPRKIYGMFFAEDCYVVHYKYFTGTTERHILYYWLGDDSTEENQDITVMKTSALDAELGGVATIGRVVQGKEPPHFLTVFSGRMIILQGSQVSHYQGSSTDITGIPESFLLQVGGNQTHNTRAIQVERRAASLNTNYVFVLKTLRFGNFLWSGKGSTGDEREMAKKIASTVVRGDYEVLYEGQEKSNFWEAIGGKEEYTTNKEQTEHRDVIPPRLFHSSYTTDAFRVEEIVNFSQSDLVQEDIMLLDARHVIYIWSGKASSKIERDATTFIPIQYLRTDPAERDEDIPVFFVKQGFEPNTFTGFFKNWNSTLWNECKSYDELRRELEGKNPVLELDTVLVDGERRFDDFVKYPVEMLREEADTLPDDIDKTRRELHLTSEDFIEVFGMAYESFAVLPIWKQQNLKKASGLF